jgi:hypothetical protein
MWDWKAHIERDWAGMGDRLILHRRVGDRFEVVTEIAEGGHAVITEVTPNERVEGIRLPEGVIDAIAEALHPGPSSSELRVLNEALNLERDRVDRVLNASLGHADRPD